MSPCQEIANSHPMGETEMVLKEGEGLPIAVDTYGGRVHVEWDPQAAVTPMGQLPFFIDFLKTADLFAPWVRDCPLAYASPNAPSKTDVLGTLMLSILSGHRRYAHITTIRCDGVNPRLLGMTKVVSEDSARKAFLGADEEACAEWLQRHLLRCYEPLLYEPWILDVDGTIKTVYGHQQGAVVGYNPHKPGRPSQVYHTYFAANLRLVLDVEVQPGNQTAACYAQPGLWKFIDRLPPQARPAFVRGDCDWGNEKVISEAEKRGLPYLFKLRKSAKVKTLIEEAFYRTDWRAGGQDWQGVEESLQLTGWTKRRRMIVLRREIKGGIAGVKERRKRIGCDQLEFAFVDALEPAKTYEYVVLVTSLEDEILTVAQHYRERADAENAFDEMKNQWGWGGYTTHDLGRCQIMARINALVYNWWSLFVRLAIPRRHAEAITSRPLLLSAVAKETQHSGQTTLTITSTHGKSKFARRILASLAEFLRKVRATTEQLGWDERWRLILSRVFRWFLKGRPLARPRLLADTS